MVLVNLSDQWVVTILELYFKLKVITEFIIPLLIPSIIIIGILLIFLNNWLKVRIMNRLGYTCYKGLGKTNVAYEFQTYWEKEGFPKINYRKIDNLKVTKIKKFIESHERRHIDKVN
jgi:hypothetical protein